MVRKKGEQGVYQAVESAKWKKLCEKACSPCQSQRILVKSATKIAQDWPEGRSNSTFPLRLRALLDHGSEFVTTAR